MSNRLQKVKDNAVTTKQHDFITEIPYEDYEFLIKQAEIVGEIGKEIKGKWSTEMVSVNRLHQIIDK